jgi:hypothetical protein
MKLIIFSILLYLTSCASIRIEEHPSGLEVKEIYPSKSTALTKQNLLQLAQVYDLSPFFYTKEVYIQSRTVSHSHPKLVLNTRNAEHPKKLLSSFLHEELHWWFTQNRPQTLFAIKELKKIYPNAPVTKSNGPDSTYVHLMVCYLEFRAVSFYLGKTEGRKVISDIMKKDKLYPWIYYQVLNKDFAIKKVVEKYKLVPSVL